MKLTKETLKGIVFDCDGTLADTMPLHWRAWQAISKRYKFHFPEDRFYSLGGVPSRDILKMIGEEQRITLDHLAVAHEKETEYLPLIAQVEPINTVVGVARENFGKIPMAVASGGTRSIIEQVLEHLGIRKLFSCGGDERRRHQPETRAGHFSRSGEAHRRGSKILPRLRGHGSRDAGHTRGGDGGGGCAVAYTGTQVAVRTRCPRLPLVRSPWICPVVFSKRNETSTCAMRR